jgi:two-component system, NarL family, sensor histidine kinase UhpB
VKDLEVAVSEWEELLEAIFQHAPIGLAITDQSARFVHVNAFFEAMLGYSVKELRRLTGWDVTHPDDHARNSVLRADLLAGNITEFTHEKRYRRKDGEVIWVKNTVTGIGGTGGLPRYTLALVEDITQRRRADEAIRENAVQLHALSRRLVDLQEAERRDIARELHDQVGQTLTALHINLELIRARLQVHGDAVMLDRTEDSLGLIQSAFASVRNVMYDLRPPLLDEYGVISSLQWYAEIFSKRFGLAVEVRGEDAPRPLPEVELALFRIAQEALNNVARHARAAKVVVELGRAEGEVSLTIVDDGAGIAPDPSSGERPGYGLINMRERAEAVGGTFDVAFTAGAGARVTVKIPRSPPRG